MAQEMNRATAFAAQFPPSEIDAEMARLKEMCETVVKMADEAISRFGTVLRSPVPEPAQSGPVAVDRQPTAQLGCEIRYMSDHLALARASLAALFERNTL